MPSLLSTAMYTLSAPVAAQVIFRVGGLVGGTVNDTSGAGGTPQPPDGTIENDWILGPGAAVAGGGVAGAFVVGGLVVGAAVAGVVVATLVDANSVVAVTATVVAETVATDVVVWPTAVVSDELPVPDDVELQAPINTSEVVRATARARMFNMCASLGGDATGSRKPH